MPNPTKINLPRINYRFIASACVPVLTVMLNKVEKDYSTVDELCDHDELSKFTRDEIKKAVTELCSRKFLLEVEKPYGCVYNCFEYVYSFFDVPVSKEEADEFEAETRHKAITIREGGRAKAAVSSMGEKQEVENPYLDNPPAETPLSENHGQYNTYNSIKRNSLLSDKSSIIPAAAKPTFNIPNVEKFAERVTDGYNAEEVKYFTEVVRENLDY